MKNKYISIVFLFGLISLTACKKLLTQEPKATATRQAVFGSQSGLDLYTNSFYTIFPSAINGMRGDAMSDYAARTDVPDFLKPDVYSPVLSTGWDWTNLRNINYFLEYNVDPGISEAVRNNYNGIARLFRAFWYYQMVQRFGDVPWYGKPLAVNDSTELFKTRDPRTLVMDSVLNDLNYACSNITVTDDPSRTMVTKWVAYALKSRICLFEGTFRKYHPEFNLPDANSWLTEAADAAQQLMQANKFQLNTDGGPGKSYRPLFINTAPNLNEDILIAAVDPSLGIFSDANWYWTSATYGNRLSFSRTFVNTYLKLDGTPFTNTPGYQTMTFANETQNRDLRLEQTIRTPGYTRINGGSVVPGPPVFSYTYTGYMPLKYTLDDEQFDQGTISTNSTPLIRYAEVLLNYAEAKAELGTLTDEDWSNTIGQLRRRGGITAGTTSLPTVVDPYLQQNYFPDISDPVILEVRRERSIELAWEGFRFYDLMRWKRGELLTQEWVGFYVPSLNTPMDLNGDGIPDVAFVQGTPANPVSGIEYVDVSPTIGGKTNPMLLKNGTSGVITWLNNSPRVWDNKMYLYPVPESARLKNNDLGQNPGW